MLAQTQFQAHQTLVSYEVASALQQSLFAHLEALGIDPKDKRIDWAADSSDMSKVEADSTLP